MRTALLVMGFGLLTLAGCGEEPEKRELIPTGPSKSAAPAALVAKPLPAIDLSKASSICRATVKAHQAATAKLTQAPRDLTVLQKANTLNAIVTDACK